MDSISSAEFRKVYAKLTEPTIVTANGHAIGEWHPFSGSIVMTKADFEAVRQATDPLIQKDDQLRYVNPPQFNSRPFRAVPKK